MTIPQCSRSLACSCNIPLNQDETSRGTACGKEEVLHFHVSCISNIANLDQDLWFARFVSEILVVTETTYLAFSKNDPDATSCDQVSPTIFEPAGMSIVEVRM